MSNSATYSPEDNKIRLYVGRVPRDEYLRLKAEGWTSTPKQDCDFVATWTPQRRDTALEYADIIEDEDQGPEDRAADRAERFSEYRDKRTSEAVGHADRYDAGPSAHGYQSQARADRAVARHDKIAGRACDAWSKAEYWQRRTAGVISHALYKSSPGVRMGRIKELESELRKREKWLEDYRKAYSTVQEIAAMADEEQKTAAAVRFFGSASEGLYDYKHPRPEEVKNAHVQANGSSLYTLLTLTASEYGQSITGSEACTLWLGRHREPRNETDWTQHLQLRIAYEHQMLDAQGGRAAFVEMEVGGWIGGHQIRKVNKSPATGRVVSVTLKVPGDKWGRTKEGFHLAAFNVERLDVSAYRAPSEEDKAALNEKKKAEKAAAPKTDCPLINPTDEDAQRLQDLWNSKARAQAEPQTVLRLTQAQYSEHSSGTHARLGTVTLTEHGTEGNQNSMRCKDYRHQVCKVRKAPSKGSDYYAADRVVIITDKPQKPLPFAQMEALRAQCPSVETMTPKLPQIQAELGKAWLSDMDRALLDDAVYVGWVSIQSMSQVYFTDAGHAAMKAYNAKPAPAPVADFAEELALF